MPKHFEGVTEVRVDIQPLDKGSVLTFWQTGVDRSATEDNWKDMLHQLKVVVNG